LVARATTTGELDSTYFGGGGFRRFPFDLAGANSLFSNVTALALAVESQTGAMTLVGRRKSVAPAAALLSPA